MKMILLSEKFYEKYGNCPEIMKKESRPYACFTVRIDDILFAIPIRHHIRHPYAFMTIEDRGLDYTKAIIIEDQTYISPNPAIIDTAEWNIIKKNENEIFYGFRKYYRQYCRALKHPDNPRSEKILKYSTLQYFEGRRFHGKS